MNKEKDIQNKINIIINQTNYDENQAKDKLLEHNENIIKVIEEYLNITYTKKKEVSTNQKIYGEIRNLMDTSSKNHYK